MGKELQEMTEGVGERENTEYQIKTANERSHLQPSDWKR